jgi:hypothetical protein
MSILTCGKAGMRVRAQASEAFESGGAMPQAKWSATP